MSEHALAPAHRAQLEASGIRPDVIDARCYWTATAADAELVKRLGHSAELVRRGPALMLPVHTVHGDVALTVIRPDLPPLDAKGRPKKYLAPRGSKPTLDVHPFARPALADATVPLWITEGQKKADAALSQGAGCAIAVHGVWAWKGNSYPAWDAVALRDRTVYLAFDSDAESNPKVQLALRRFKAMLGSRGARVRIVHLEPGPDGRKVGLDDALAAGATLEQLAATSTESLRVLIPPDDKRPELDVTALDEPVTLAAFVHLEQAGIYQTRSGELAAVRLDQETPVVQRLTAHHVRALLGRVVRCVRHTAEAAVPCYLPKDVAEVLVHYPLPPLPPLAAVRSGPTFTADWRWLDQPGYDPASGVYLAFRFTPRPVPLAPSEADVAEARRLWDEEVFADFEFASTADRAAALALALTPLVREAIAGPTPLFSAEAPKAGSGKGLTVAVCLTPAVGPHGWASVSLTGEDELRKALTTYLIEQRAAIVFDNVGGFVKSPTLAKVLTDAEWTDRLMGANRSATAAVRATWAMTANNATLHRDIARRIVPIRLEPQTDHPELRTGFRHSDLETWVAERRADLLWALAVFVRRWLSQGRPGWTGAVLGSYTSWTSTIGAILATAGYHDFLTNRADLLASADPDSAAWEAFFEDWWNRHRETPQSATALLALAQEHDVYVSGDDDRARAASLGHGLAQHRDAFFGPYQLRQGTGRDRRKWLLRQRTAEKGAGDSGDTRDTSYIRSLRAEEISLGLEIPGSDAMKLPAHVAHVSPDLGLGDAREDWLRDPVTRADEVSR